MPFEDLPAAPLPSPAETLEQLETYYIMPAGGEVREENAECVRYVFADRTKAAAMRAVLPRRWEFIQSGCELVIWKPKRPQHTPPFTQRVRESLRRRLGKLDSE